MMTRTAEISATPKMTAKDLASFVAQIPEYAEITFREERGDPLHIYEDNDLPSHHATGLLTRAINRIEQEALNE